MADVNGEAGPTVAPEWSVDELAAATGLPVRTIREYQSMGVLPPPRKRGRVGVYGPAHLRRLELIARLRQRGHSLAGIRDLLGSWSAGADLGEVLGLEADQLVHIDEPGAPATLEQLRSLLPDLVPGHLDALASTGVIEPLGPDHFCVPSPSLLQLTIDALAAEITPEDVLRLLGAIHTAAVSVGDDVVERLSHLPSEGGSPAAATLTTRGRGLLAHGIGRMTLHHIGRRLAIDDDEDFVSPRPAAIAHRSEGR